MGRSGNYLLFPGISHFGPSRAFVTRSGVFGFPRGCCRLRKTGPSLGAAMWRGELIGLFAGLVAAGWLAGRAQNSDGLHVVGVVRTYVHVGAKTKGQRD